MITSTFFSGGPMDRAGQARKDAEQLAAAVAHADTRFVAFWRSQCMIDNSAAVYLQRSQLGFEPSAAALVYLGLRGEQHLFAVALPDTLPAAGPQAERFENFRQLLGGVSPADGAVLAYAKGMLEWQQRHQHCGVCGHINDTAEGGFVMSCSNADCGQRCFPRVDPAIIVLVTHHDHCLLGQQASWPEGRYSTIAGFAEPGESLEDAVRREVQEETNILVADVHYLASQPWPFPAAMMIGFHATASSTKIRLNDAELSAAGWFSRTDIEGGSLVLPPASSIAFQLIAAWFDAASQQPLASLGLSGDFSRSAATVQN
jgi:NAD+ diphosphatase